MKLKDKKAGDWVYHVIDGWRKTQETCLTDAIKVDDIRYVNGNQHNIDQLNPTIYPSNPFDPSDQPPCEFVRGEVIMVSDETREWRCRCFMDQVGDKFYCPPDGLSPDDNDTKIIWNRARKLTPAEKGEV